MVGNFTTIQEQHQSTQILSVTSPMSPTIAFHFFEQNDENYCGGDETTNYLSNTSISNQTQSSSSSKLKKCSCCPYGYHIDLDFIRYCEELAKNGKRPTNKQLERRNKRRQRKSLEVMLGYNDQWIFDYENQMLANKQQKPQFQTVYEVCVCRNHNFYYKQKHQIFCFILCKRDKLYEFLSSCSLCFCFFLLNPQLFKIRLSKNWRRKQIQAHRMTTLIQLIKILVNTQYQHRNSKVRKSKMILSMTSYMMFTLILNEH